MRFSTEFFFSVDFPRSYSKLGLSQTISHLTWLAILCPRTGGLLTSERAGPGPQLGFKAPPPQGPSPLKVTADRSPGQGGRANKFFKILVHQNTRSSCTRVSAASLKIVPRPRTQKRSILDFKVETLKII